jgi:hypothetical protein
MIKPKVDINTLKLERATRFIEKEGCQKLLDTQLTAGERSLLER